MLLKNLMEDKQLNFNQPFLSVKRFSSTVASEKDDKRKTDKFIPNIPRLPSYKSELKSGPVGNPGTVPFIWEQSPGRPKGESKPRSHGNERPPIAPKLPPGRILKAKKQDSDKVSEDPSVTKQPGKVHYGLQNVPSSDVNVTKIERSKDIIKDENSDSGDGDEEYLDAQDSLSRTESFFLNCSASGISGLDCPDVKPFGTFSTDPQTRDYMMGRFLPAAKAMASEATPQYAPRKQPMVWERPREVKKVVSGDKRPPLRYSNTVPYYSQVNVEEESDDEYDEQGKYSAKVCGLLPRFCLKNSFCLLNPVPGMSVRTRVPMSPVSRTQTSSSSADSCSEIENEHTRVSTFVRQSVGGLKTTELQEDKRILKNESNQSTLQGNSHKLEGSTLYRRLQGNGESTYHNELPQSNGFISHKEGLRSFQELLADGRNNGEGDPGNPMVEKTLYVDIIHKVESPKLNSCSPDMKGLSNFRENDFMILAKSKEMEEFKDIENLSTADEEVTLQPNIQKPVDFGLPSSAEKSNQGYGLDEDSYQNFTTSAINNLDFEAQQPPKVENFHRNPPEFPAPPPLPKSPSDSWLWRTLPSMSSKNPSLRSYLGTVDNSRSQASKTPSNVKTTKGQHQHLRFSEEPLPPIRET